MRRYLHELRAPEISNVVTAASVLLVPVGAIEQHGPHLPLSTDLDVAEGLASRVVEAHGERLGVWLLPSISFAKSDEHDWAPGTMSLSASTLIGVMDDLGRSIARLPTRRVAFLNGHGGNSAFLEVALRQLRIQHGLLTFLLEPRMPRDDGPQADEAELAMGVHGGRDETAMMLELRPELVDMTQATRSVPETMARRKHVKFGGTVPFGWSSSDLAENGVIGDPTLATNELGKQIIDAAVTQLTEQLTEIAAFNFPH